MGFFFQSTLEIVEKACNYIKELKAKLENGIVSYLLQRLWLKDPLITILIIYHVFVLQVVCKRAASLLAFSDEELQKVRLELDNMRAERDRLQEILKMAGR